jgi:hypothetical protein
MPQRRNAASISLGSNRHRPPDLFAFNRPSAAIRLTSQVEQLNLWATSLVISGRAEGMAAA